MERSPIRLTQTVKKGGCAAKVAAVELRKILAGVRFPPAGPDLLIDGRDFDDAAVQRINDEVAIVQTLDFFTPIVDSPFDFGRIAAANALSDVYAMGARPTMALAILAFPLGELPNECIAEVMNGACSALAEAGAALAGGHSIDDDTLKFGLSVTGLVHPKRAWANSGAGVGDQLILTKPLGVGAYAAALKRGLIDETAMAPAIESMSALNDVPGLLGGPEWEGAVRGATDVTGFGLAGHAMQMAIASGARFAFSARAVPRLPRAAELLAAGALTKAHKTNKDYVSRRLAWSADAPEADAERTLFFDPQTSGGLLLSVDPARAAALLARVQTRFPEAALVGEVLRCETPGDAGELAIH